MSSSSNGSGDRQRQQLQQPLLVGNGVAGVRSHSLSPEAAAGGSASGGSSSNSSTREWVETQSRRLASDMQQQPPTLHRCRTEGGPLTEAEEASASIDLASCRSEAGLLAMSVGSGSGSVGGGAGAADYDSSGDKSTGRPDRPRQQSRLRSHFNPLYKQRNDMLHRLFKDLPAEERLVTDSSCAWDRSGLLVQGRLYATASRLFFYSKIIGFETRFAIPLTGITGMSRERTARVIPNAICVLTSSDRYFFTSISSRDRIHAVLDLLWQKACRPEPLDPVLFWELVHETYGNQLGLTPEDPDYVPSVGRRRSSAEEATFAATPEDSNGEDALAASSDPGAGEVSPSSSIGGAAAAAAVAAAASSSDPLSAEFGTRRRGGGGHQHINDEEVLFDGAGGVSGDPCERHEHLPDEYLNVQLPASVDTVFQCLFAHKSAWFRLFARQRGMTDVCAEPWRPAPAAPDAAAEAAGGGSGGGDGGGGGGGGGGGEWRARRVSFTLPLNNAVGPRSAQQVEEQTYRLADCRPGRSYCVDVTVRSREVPYCDSFHTRARYCLRSAGPEACRLRVSTDMKFTRSLFKIVRNLIDSSARKGLADHFSAMRACLLAYLAARPATRGTGSRPAATIGTVADAVASLDADTGADTADTADADESADALVPDLQSAALPNAAVDHRRGAAGRTSGRWIVGCLLLLCCLLLVCFFSLHARCNRLQVLLDRAAQLAQAPLPPQPSHPPQLPPPPSRPPGSGGVGSATELEQLAHAVETALESLEGIRQSLVELRQRILERRPPEPPAVTLSP